MNCKHKDYLVDDEYYKKGYKVVALTMAGPVIEKSCTGKVERVAVYSTRAGKKCGCTKRMVNKCNRCGKEHQ